MSELKNLTREELKQRRGTPATFLAGGSYLMFEEKKIKGGGYVYSCHYCGQKLKCENDCVEFCGCPNSREAKERNDKMFRNK